MHQSMTLEAPPAKAERGESRLDRHLAKHRHPTPFLVVDLDEVADRYRQLTEAFPGVEIHYAVKANPGQPILDLLVRLGARFEIASIGELHACLDAGAPSDSLSFGNSVKPAAHIAEAYELGVRRFVFDAPEELDKLVALAPGSLVVARLRCDGRGSDWALGGKFGCPPEMAEALLVRAAAATMRAGVSFHVGSQQRDPEAWTPLLEQVADLRRRLLGRGIELELVNLGGGLPGRHLDPTPPLASYAAAIGKAVTTNLGPQLPALVLEPGRFLVADAGVLQTEVLLVTHRDSQRWVFLDAGLYGGLAETMGEAVRYRVRSDRDGPLGPVVVAGPTCDSTDVLYQNTLCLLPMKLRPGDRVDVLAAGAYTTAYASRFNGFPPPAEYYLPAAG
jgi:ornithine decarboxylase